MGSPLLHVLLSTLTFLVITTPSLAENAKGRYIMYLTGQHPIVPEPALVSNITHVALAFMRSDTFNQENPTSWPLYTTISEIRPKFAAGTQILVAIGGWGDTQGFSQAARSEEGRNLFAANVRRMIDEMDADGVDIDWEYPGGNGEDYKQIPNSEKEWEIDTYPKLLSAIRKAIGPSKTISAAVPGLPRDMLAFTSSTIPEIMKSIDFLNIMTYDLMNRRDNVTKHHTGLLNSLESIDAYLDAGVRPDQANLGFAFYLKWFKTDPDASCSGKPVGCKTELMEDPNTGADLGKAGAFSWHDDIPTELVSSCKRALKGATYDKEGGGTYFFDAEENLFWSWDAPNAIAWKFPRIMEKRRLGGVFAWGLGEDAPHFEHLKTTNRYVKLFWERADQGRDGGRSEL